MAEEFDVLAKRLKNLYEYALSGTDGVKKYIIQICDDLRNGKLKKDLKRNKPAIDKIFKDLAFKIANPEFWKDDKNKIISGEHGGYVGKTADGLKIIKRDTNQSDRIYFVRYFNPENKKTYVRLLGYQLKGKRDEGWKKEVRNIKNRYRGEIFDVVESFKPDSSGGVLDFIDTDSHMIQTHGGYIWIRGEVDLTQNYIESLEHEANIIITDDQFRQIAKQTPLLIDGHAGTGKSIIIALRIAIHFANYDITPHDKRDEIIPNLLVVAYNQRVLKMIEHYAKFWIYKMIPENNQKYMKRIEYIPTLRLYHMLLNKNDNRNIIDPTKIESTKTFVNFYRFQTEFFSKLDDIGNVSAEQAWHFIRGILKGRELGWFGEEEIKSQDFGSVSGNPDSKVPRRATDKMPLELIELLITIHKKYEHWRKENNFLDDIDLVRRSLGAIKKDDSLTEDFIAKFHTVLIDEGQDLTIVEFKLLTYLLKEYSDKVNIVVGGDPLQTINPTGFSWESLETFITQKVIEDSGKKKFDINPSRMLVSHRMPKPLVDFSNVIISARANVSNEKISPMKALDELSNEGQITRVAYNVDDEAERELMNEFIASALGSDIGTIIWARDSKELEYLKGKDSTITSLADMKNDDDLMNEDIHSIESVKGLEFETVILYRFGDLSDNFEELINTSMSDNTQVNDEETYERLYFLNRLFIASTRSKKNLIIIDSDDSMENSWNETLWKGKAHNTLPIVDFVELFKTPPTLIKAENYYQKGLETGNTDLLHKALASAKQCTESPQKTELLKNIEITTLELETNSYLISDEVKAVKRDRLIQLYEETGDLEKAIYERIILERWNIIYDKYKSKKKKFPLAWTIAAFKSTEDPKYRDTLIDIYSKHIKHILNAEAKGTIEKTFRRICRENLQQMDEKRLKKIHERFDWDEWIEILSPSWSEKGNKEENDQKSKSFLARMRIKFGSKRSEWKDNVEMMILNIEINNPDSQDRVKADIIRKLAEKGDTNAVKKAIRSIFKEKEISVTSKKWLTIQRYLESVSDDLEEASNERNKLISRVNDLCALLRLNNEEFAPIQEVESWLGALNVINKIRKNQDINSNGMQEISFIKGDGDIYNGFKTILSMDNQKVQSLVKYLITILVKSNAKRRGFIAWDWNNIEKVLNFFESNKNLNIDTSDLYERILDTIANTSKQVFSSEMIRFILKSTDEERYNRTPRKTRMVNSLQQLFETHGWYEWYWKYPGTLYPWLLGSFKDDNKSGIPYKNKLQFHLMVRNWKDDKDTQEISDLEALCKLPGYASKELQIEIKKAAGYDDERLTNDMIQTMDIVKLRSLSNELVSNVLFENDFDLNSISWVNNNWFCDLVTHIPKHDKKIKDILKNVIFFSIYSDSFASMVLNLFPQKIETMDNPLHESLLDNFWKNATKKLDERIQLVFNNSPFWELMRRDGNELSGAMALPTKYSKKYNFSINALAVIDVLTYMSKYTNDKNRANYLKNIGILSKSISRKDELKEALFSTDLFNNVFVEEPELLQSAKELF